MAHIFRFAGRWPLAVLVSAAVLVPALPPPALAAQPTPLGQHRQSPADRAAAALDLRTTRISVGPGGRQTNNESFDASVSANGRYVAFSSEASNLVAGDTNDSFDVFVRDRQRGLTSRVSLRGDGHQANSVSSDPAISATGRYVAFTSTASDLVAGDTNGAVDVFVRDRQRKVTTRVSVSSTGRQSHPVVAMPFEFAATAISANGRFVAFTSTAPDLVPGDTNRATDVFVHDRRTGDTRRVSVSSGERQAAQSSLTPAISADGRYVAYTSSAALVAGDTNGKVDVFVRDRLRGTTSRVSVGPARRQANGQSQSPAISAHGRFVAYTSDASNLVAGDTNGGADVFVRDRSRGLTSRVSLSPRGRQAHPGSTPNSVVPETAVSADGRYVAFSSTADNLVRRDSNKVADVFVRDRRAGVTTRVSVSSAGRQANATMPYLFPAISANGRVVAFTSESSNLVAGDTNGYPDVFVRAAR